MDHGGGASGDWAATTDQPLIGTASARCFETPELGQPGQWAELRTPALFLNQANYVLEFARRIDLSQASARFQVRLLDQNDNLVNVSADYSSPFWTTWIVGGPVAYPANYANSIAVGASTDFDRRADYSDYGSSLFCVAPSNMGWNGVATTDTSGASGYDNQGNHFMGFGGTSAATPLTAGVAALVLSKNANLTRAQLKDSLRLGCDRVGHLTYDPTTLWNEQYGYGRVNAYNSLTVTAADTTVPVVSSVVTRTGRRVEVTFSEKMGSGVSVPGNYTLTGSGKGTLAPNPASVSWVSGYKYLLEWSAGEMIAGTGNLTITVSSAVKDVAGNSIGTANDGSANGSRVIHAISCGPVLSSTTDPIYPFESERNYWSGVGWKNSMTINSIVNNDGTPTGVYKTAQSVWSYTFYPGDIVFTLPNITAGLNHTVRLYFANSQYGAFPGDIRFGIYINNVLKEANFDLIGQAGGSYIGIWRDYANITANGSGQIVVRIVPYQSWNNMLSAYYYNATINGIKVTAQ